MRGDRRVAEAFKAIYAKEASRFEADVFALTRSNPRQATVITVAGKARGPNRNPTSTFHALLCLAIL
jgi:hypothetical protein